jgi:hypothetical protein
MKIALPPDDGRITYRLDGWTINGDDDMRMPHDVAREIARNMPGPPERFGRIAQQCKSVSDIRARMACRARMIERMGRLSDG